MLWVSWWMQFGRHFEYWLWTDIMQRREEARVVMLWKKAKRWFLCLHLGTLWISDSNNYQMSGQSEWSLEEKLHWVHNDTIRQATLLVSEKLFFIQQHLAGNIIEKAFTQPSNIPFSLHMASLLNTLWNDASQCNLFEIQFLILQPSSQNQPKLTKPF